MKTAFPTLQQTVKITLYSNIPFDNTYKNHCLISDLFKYNGSSIYGGTSAFGLAKERFINRGKRGSGYYYPRYELTGDFNFDYSNGLLTSLTLELTPAQTNANYMKVVCGTDIYYYFITGINQVNYDTYKLSLELDVLMTYQDEFLEGIKDIPVFTTRKHCTRFANDGLSLRCPDYKSGDSVFAGVKPNIIKSKKDLHFDNENYAKLESIKWLYICLDDSYSFLNSYRYTYKGITHPLAMACIPINVTSLTITDGDNVSVTITQTEIKKVIDDLVGAGYVKGCKISCYPPFNVSTNCTISGSNGTYTITVGGGNLTTDSGDYYWENEKTDLLIKFSNVSTQGCFVIHKEHNGNIDFNDIDFPEFLNDDPPSNTSDRLQDPKLLFKPFRKYTISATYSDGNEFFPELIYANGFYQYADFVFKGVYTSYIGDYNIFTYQGEIQDSNYVKHYRYYKENNIGLSSMVNYNIPTGTNALDVFNSTQAQSFYTSKVASGVSSGLAIAGGIASIIAGVALTGGTAGTGAGAGVSMIVGGASAIASGTAGVATTIKSSVAKIEDLKNTPDAVNVQGGSFVSDYARTDMMPFILTYECSDVIKHQADDYFYQYGYEVARDCYFNTEMKYNNNAVNVNDTNLIGRSVFNYVQTKDDISNKINSDIPLIVKQKLSKIFNDGITLWSFFDNLSLWGTTSVTNANNPDKWFMKHDLDNTELTIIRENA